MSRVPSVTVVIATYNRADEVCETVGRFRALPERPDVIVVDNGSTDGTVPRLKTRHPTVRVLGLSTNLGAAARNAGIDAAATPYVALADDDTWWSPGSLGRAAEILDRHSRLAVVTARVLIAPHGVEDPVCRRMADSPLPRDPSLPGCPILGFLAGASMVRRAAVLAAGGFEPRYFIGNEEGLLSLDLAADGWAMTYVQECVVYHSPSPHRDRDSRRRFLRRNALWTAWLRRPLPVALKLTVRSMAQAWNDRQAAAGVASAFVGLPWVIRHRRVLPDALESALATLEAQYHDPA